MSITARRSTSILAGLLVLTGLSLSVSSQAHSGRAFEYFKTKVVTTEPAVAGIAKYIGGDEVVVHSLTSGNGDIHNTKISDAKLWEVNRADILLKTGTDCDPWVKGILEKSKNRKIADGSIGNVDCSIGIERPANLDQVHWHYWLEPQNKNAIALNIKDALVRTDPEHAKDYERRYMKFRSQIDENVSGCR